MSKILKKTCVTWSPETMILSFQAPAYIKTDALEKKLQENVNPILQSAEEEAESILRDAEETAQKIVEEAARQAEDLRKQAQAALEEERLFILEAARREADEIREQARREGFELGREEGRRQALEEERERVSLAQEVLAAAYADKEKIIAEAEPFLVELAVEIARKIIGDELSSAPDRIAAFARSQLQRSRVHGQITLCVNHRYYQWMEEHRSQFLALLDGQAELSIIPDYAVQDEGCVIRTPFGSVDARIDTQLAEVKQALLEIARGRDADDHA